MADGIVAHYICCVNEASQLFHEEIFPISIRVKVRGRSAEFPTRYLCAWLSSFVELFTVTLPRTSGQPIRAVLFYLGRLPRRNDLAQVPHEKGIERVIKNPTRLPDELNSVLLEGIC